MEKESIAGLLAGLVGNHNLMIDEPMRNHTSFKVGGPADILVTPDCMDSLMKVVDLCRQESIPVFIMGNGTNLIVRDGGIKGVVLKIFDNLSKYEVAGSTIKAEAGILMARLSRIALEHGLAGLEFAEGIPGTLGGAVTMNAGAYTGEMAGVVLRTEYMYKDGRVGTLDKEGHRFGKRASFVQSDGGVVLRTELKLERGDKEEIKARMDDFSRQRREKQPLEVPSAGSVFKRPEGYFAGKLVQDCGLKGFRMGGAEVSCKHCGFIVNTDHATASDVIGIIKHIQTAVKEKFGVELQTEVKIVGKE